MGFTLYVHMSILPQTSLPFRLPHISNSVITPSSCPSPQQPEKERSLDTKILRENVTYQQKLRLETCSCKPRNTKDCLQPQEATREAHNRCSLRISTWNQSCWHLEFQLRAPRNGRERFLLFEATQFVVICCGKPSKLIQDGMKVRGLLLRQLS